MSDLLQLGMGSVLFWLGLTHTLGSGLPLLPAVSSSAPPAHIRIKSVFDVLIWEPRNIALDQKPILWQRVHHYGIHCSYYILHHPVLLAWLKIGAACWRCHWGINLELISCKDGATSFGRACVFKWPLYGLMAPENRICESEGKKKECEKDHPCSSSLSVTRQDNLHSCLQLGTEKASH